MVQPSIEGTSRTFGTMGDIAEGVEQEADLELEETISENETEVKTPEK